MTNLYINRKITTHKANPNSKSAENNGEFGSAPFLPSNEVTLNKWSSEMKEYSLSQFFEDYRTLVNEGITDERLSEALNGNVPEFKEIKFATIDRIGTVLPLHSANRKFFPEAKEKI